MKYDAFISYRRENGFLMAQVIRDRLRERGISCFLDLEEDRSGKFDEALLQAIDRAPNFILILPKNALARCENEDDWVRREILAAVKGSKTIIPVMYDGFKWPQKWREGIPEEIRQLQYQQGVSMSQEYLSAMIDKIINYMTGLDLHIQHSYPDKKAYHLPPKAVPFISRLISEKNNIQSIDMAFHAGAHWRRDSDKVDLLAEIIDKQLTLRVLVNSSQVAEQVCSHMRQPLKKYVGMDNCVSEWMELQDMYPSFVHVRVSRVPLMHRTYLIRCDDGSGAVNVKYYTYGNYTPEKDFRLCFDSDLPEYTLYADEFEYLWRQAAALSL